MSFMRYAETDLLSGPSSFDDDLITNKPAAKKKRKNAIIKSNKIESNQNGEKNRQKNKSRGKKNDMERY